MQRNKKLEKIITGQKITNIETTQEENIITLNNGSIIEVKGKLNNIPTNKVIQTVWQDKKILEIRFEDNSTNNIDLNEETSSVFMRDKDGKFLYSD